MDEPYDLDEAFADDIAPQDLVGNLSCRNQIQTSRLQLAWITSSRNAHQREYRQGLTWMVGASPVKGRRDLDTQGYQYVELSPPDATSWARVDPDCQAVRTLVEVYRQFGLEPEIWPTHPGSGPISLFTEDLGMPVVFGGMGHGGREHAPDEYATLRGIRQCQESFVRFMHGFAMVQ